MQNYTLEQCRSQLASLTELEDGWFDGHGKVISREALKLADELLCRTVHPRPYIYPKADGGIIFEWKVEKQTHFLKFSPSDEGIVFIDYLPNENESILWCHIPKYNLPVSPLYSSIINRLKYYNKK